MLDKKNLYMNELKEKVEHISYLLKEAQIPHLFIATPKEDDENIWQHICSWASEEYCPPPAYVGLVIAATFADSEEDLPDVLAALFHEIRHGSLPKTQTYNRQQVFDQIKPHMQEIENRLEEEEINYAFLAWTVYEKKELTVLADFGIKDSAFPLFHLAEVLAENGNPLVVLVKSLEFFMPEVE